ncbi:MAG TPA: response regulator transcription factor [Candidatus Limnocylindrales bacterium]|jgi:DNA-binding response OmpR family regulator
MKRILIVEDDARIAGLIRDYLERAGYDVLRAADGRAALVTARSERPDLVVLDLGLPGLDGMDVTRALRRDSEVPIVMLTARTDEVDRVAGLELGADDYVPKPFSPRELVARIRAVLRRTEGPEHRVGILRAGELEIDLDRRRVAVGGRAIGGLTVTEFDVLATLARQPGRVFTRGQLLDAVHGISGEAYERTIDGHVKNLRRKLGEPSGRPRLVETVHGVGYRLADEPMP